VPIGLASDRVDRRKVLLAVAALALAADLAFVLLAPEGRMVNLALVGVFGAAIFAMYPIIVAHANDHAPAGTSIQVSGGLLMVFGVGSIIGPLFAGALMTGIGPSGLFLTTVAAHSLMIAYTLLRIARSPAVPAEEKAAFQISMPARVVTPETAALASGDGEDMPLEPELQGEKHARGFADAPEGDRKT
jgi:MFS family permease